MVVDHQDRNPAVSGQRRRITLHHGRPGVERGVTLLKRVQS
jgi:hypothetical protein